MAVMVDQEKCNGCGLCRKNCPYGAVEIAEKKAAILARCTSCGACIESCPTGALTSDLAPRSEADPGLASGVWVLAETRSGEVTRTSFELLGRARSLADELGQDVAAVLLGDRVAGLAGSLIASGADQVFLAESPELARYRTLPFTRVLADLIRARPPRIFLLPATHLGRDLAPRLARRLGTGLTADCTVLGLDEQGRLLQTRPAFGGNVMATIVSPYAWPQMATVRPGIMIAATPDPDRRGEVIPVAPTWNGLDLAATILEVLQADRPRVEFHQAKIIVAGGRGLGGPEGFELLAHLAVALGAELGGTRIAVEEGWIPQERQIGQTGQTVRPELYIACGLSGAIQHRAGMLDSRYIVGINRDPDAPIFQIADFRLVGDLFKIVPALIQAVGQPATGLA